MECVLLDVAIQYSWSEHWIAGAYNTWATRVE